MHETCQIDTTAHRHLTSSPSRHHRRCMPSTMNRSAARHPPANIHLNNQEAVTVMMASSAFMIVIRDGTPPTSHEHYTINNHQKLLNSAINLLKQ